MSARFMRRATPVTSELTPCGIEVTLADGSRWRQTVSGWWLVRFPTRLNRAALRGHLRASGGAALAAAYAMPPAQPAPDPVPTLALISEQQEQAKRCCGSDAFTASVGDPTTCIRCVQRRTQVATD